MRLALIPLALLTAGCWTPGPGQLDPTRYPWDQKHLTAQAKPKGTYCIVALEQPSATGISSTRIVARGSVPAFEQVPPGQLKTMEMACQEPR